MDKKGYIYTVSTFFVMSSVLIVALFFSSQVDEIEIAGPKLSFLYDDVRGDIYDILGMNWYVSTHNNLTTITINDTLPADDVGEALLKYEYFIEKNYTTSVDQDLFDRAGSLAGADISMGLGNKEFVMVPYNYAYRYSNLAKNQVQIYPLNNSNKLQAVVINITADRAINSVSGELSDGDLPVRIIVNYGNNTYENDSYIARNDTSTFLVNMSNNELKITIGEMNLSGQTRESSIVIEPDDNRPVQVMTSLVFNRSYYFKLDSGFSITLRDVIGHRLAKREGTNFTKFVDYTKIKGNMYFAPDAIGGDVMYVQAPEPPNGTSSGGGEKPPPGGIDPPEPPEFLGYCYCAAPCYFWEEYWSDEAPCPQRSCPDWCEPGQNMLTYIL